MKMTITNPYAIDYDAPVKIVDPLSKRVYTQEEAEKASYDVQRRLTIVGTKIGCQVYTIEEARKIMREKE